MASYAFNHDTNKIDECLGIGDEQSKKLLEAAKHSVIAAFLTDDSIDDAGKMIEMCINLGQPKNVVEAIFLGFHLGRGEAKMIQLQGKMSALMDKP